MTELAAQQQTIMLLKIAIGGLVTALGVVFWLLIDAHKQLREDARESNETDQDIAAALKTLVGLQQTKGGNGNGSPPPRT